LARELFLAVVGLLPLMSLFGGMGLGEQRTITMKEEEIGMMVMGGIFLIVGIALLFSYGLASWGINNLRSGRRWAGWFGEERAIAILRFGVGPVVILMSGFGIWMVLSGNMPR
jgi:hypothetical protein